MISREYVWFVWACAFLVPWLILYLRFPQHRKVMLWASIFTAPFGLTEPLFVPEYWAPPSLFDLALRTGFDIESLIFSFGIGGVGAVIVNVLTRRVPEVLDDGERAHPRHRLHRWVLVAPFAVFLGLLPLGWNPIYPAIAAMVAGAAATVWCRPDLARTTVLDALIFLGYYVVFLGLLEVSSPGYVEDVWTLEALSGVRIGFMPLEELLFALGFGAYWAALYEHYTWRALRGYGGAIPA